MGVIYIKGFMEKTLDDINTILDILGENSIRFRNNLTKIAHDTKKSFNEVVKITIKQYLEG